MLSEKEERFIAYWAANRQQEKNSFLQFIKGLSTGIIIGAAIVILLAIGWYERANMEANAWLSPVVVIIAIIAIALFMAYFYRNYQWEQKEQQYLELLAKKKRSAANNVDNAEKS